MYCFRAGPKFYEATQRVAEGTMSDVTIKLNMGSFGVEVTGPSEYAEKKVEELVGRYLASGKTATIEQASAPNLLEQGEGRPQKPNRPRLSARLLS
jgi:hypothetical protein